MPKVYYDFLSLSMSMIKYISKKSSVCYIQIKIHENEKKEENESLL